MLCRGRRRQSHGHSWSEARGLSQGQSRAAAAHVEPPTPFSPRSPSCFASQACGCRVVRTAFERASRLATKRPQGCVRARRARRRVTGAHHFLHAAMSTACRCLRGDETALSCRRASLLLLLLQPSLQAGVERKEQNFPQKFPRQFWTSGTCQALCGMLRTSTPHGGFPLCGESSGEN